MRLDVMSPRQLEPARAQGVSPELLHRFAPTASGGMDTLPHNGAVITLLAITGLTHGQSYPDIFAITVLQTLTSSDKTPWHRFYARHSVDLLSPADYHHGQCLHAG